MNYYFLETANPPLEFPDKLELGFKDLVFLYRENLTKEDFKRFQKLQKYIDLLNVKSLLCGHEVNPNGNLSKVELEEALSEPKYFGEEIFDLFSSVDSNEEKIKLFPKILYVYLNRCIETSVGFLKWYFQFERDLRLILTSYRCKKLKRDVSIELSFADRLDPIMAEILSQKDSPHFEAPYGYEELAEVLQVSENDPKRQYVQLAEYKIRTVKEQVEMDNFSTEKILAYAVMVTVLEDYHDLSLEEGHKILNEVMRDNE